MAKRSDFKRRKNDAYFTPESCIPSLLLHLPRNVKFIEPAAGRGDLIDHLEKHGHQCVKGYDIAPKRKDIVEMDMMNIPVGHFNDCDYIISNFPWTRQILHPAINRFSSILPTWSLHDLDWAATKQAKPYLEYCHKIVIIGRVKWIEDSKYTSKDSSAWYLFDQTKKRDSEGPVFYGR